MRNPETGGEAILQIAQQYGIEVAFGYSGGAVLPVFDAFETAGTDIQLITPAHEQGGAHMADGYARASGKPGFVAVTSGPGALNTMSALLTAQNDSVPIVFVTGQVPTTARDPHAFQSAPVVEMAQFVTKSAEQIRDVKDTPRVVHAAFRLAMTGRPGPVLIDVPKDIGGAKFDGDISEPAFEPAPEPPLINKEDVDAIVDAWRRAERPVILAGQGVIISGASEELLRLAEHQDTPVTTTLLGKGAFPETHDLSLGMLGMHGTVYANRAVQESDCIINFGSRLDDRIVGNPDTFASGKFLVHVDIDPNEIGKVIQPNVGVVADARAFMTALIGALAVDSTEGTKRREWNAQIMDNKINHPLSYEKGEQLSMQQVIEAVYDHTHSDDFGSRTIVTTDVGQHQMWAAQHWKVDDEREWITSGGAGTMGYGLPAAIGAKLAVPDKEVVAFVGDGGFQMTSSELMTACKLKLPIKIFVMDNRYLGMVRQWQDAYYGGRESGVEMAHNPDFVALAKAYGAEGIAIDSEDNLQSGIEQAFAINDRPVVIHVSVETKAAVYPMIPPGADYSKMILGPTTEEMGQPVGST